jgi:hypothetical protein
MGEEKKDSYGTKKKSWPKCYGLKSVLDYQGHIVVTSVAKEADTAKNETGGFDQETQSDCTLIRGVDDMEFSLADGEKKIKVKAKDAKNDFLVEKPFSYAKTEDGAPKLSPKEDYLGIAKYICHDIFGQPLEERYDDNIHYQIAYNIADLEKIIFYEVNDACFAVDNILKAKDFDEAASLRPIDRSALSKEEVKRAEMERDFIGEFNPKPTFNEEVAFAASKPTDEDGKTKVTAANVQLDTFARFNRLAEPYSPFFNNLFIYRDKKIESRKQPGDDYFAEHNYNVIRVLASLRHFFTHRTWGKADVADGEVSETSFFDFSHELVNKYKGVADFASMTFANKANELNESFANTCATDLVILCAYFGTDTKDEAGVRKHLRSYYDFVVGESAKNIGINMTKVREKMIDAHYGEGSDNNLRSKEHDSYRGRLYRLFSYVLFLDVESDPTKLVDPNVAKLRLARTDEDKDAIYAQMAEDCFQAFKDDFSEIIRLVEANVRVKGEESKQKFPFALTVENPLLGDEETLIFVQMVFFLSLFLGEKESNDLLTSLSNKFDNIVQFMKVLVFLDPEHKQVHINGKYSLFRVENAEKIATQLRVAQKVSRMRKNLKKADVSASLLGEAMNVFSRHDFYAPDDVGADGKIVRDPRLAKMLDDTFNSKKGSDDRTFRNFLLNNVLASRRFAYIIRYFDARGVRRLMDADSAVRFVLGTIPEAQIRRYYGVMAQNPAPFPQMIDFLASQMKLLDIDFLLGKKGAMQQWAKSVGRVPADKQVFLTQVGLYLTVAYLIVKNVVNANARFSSAFASYERDRSLYAKSMGEKAVNKAGGDLNSYDADLTRYFIGQLPGKDANGNDALVGLNKYYFKSQRYLLDYCRYFERLEKECNADKLSVGKLYRNHVVHLNYIAGLANIKEIEHVRSYYDIYVYLVEKGMVTSFEDPVTKAVALAPAPSDGADKPADKSLLSDLQFTLDKYHSYSWMFFKWLNAMFGYCLPRFQNLTTANLFNERDYGRSVIKRPEPKSQFDAAKAK